MTSRPNSQGGAATDSRTGRPEDLQSRVELQSAASAFKIRRGAHQSVSLRPPLIISSLPPSPATRLNPAPASMRSASASRPCSRRPGPARSCPADFPRRPPRGLIARFVAEITLSRVRLCSLTLKLRPFLVRNFRASSSRLPHEGQNPLVPDAKPVPQTVSYTCDKRNKGYRYSNRSIRLQTR